MSDIQDRVTRLATEARQRADVAGTQAAWQEGRAHGLREAAAAIATATDTRTLRDDTRTLRDDIRDYIADLTARGTPPGKQPSQRLPLLSPSQLAIGEAAAVAKRAAWRQVAEDLLGILAANEPEEAES